MFLSSADWAGSRLSERLNDLAALTGTSNEDIIGSLVVRPREKVLSQLPDFERLLFLVKGSLQTGGTVAPRAKDNRLLVSEKQEVPVEPGLI